MLFFKNIKKFFTLSKREILLFLSCYVISAAAAVVIRFIPLKKYYRIFEYNPVEKLSEHEMKKGIFVLIKAMKRVKKRAFWDCSCLNQVITLKWLANKNGIPASVKFKLTRFVKNDARAHASIVFDCQYEYLALDDSSRIFVDLSIN